MTEKTARILIVTGEASGDLQGAFLAQRIKKIAPNVEIVGIGSKRMYDAGVSLIEDSSTWSAIGVVEALKLVPKLLAAMGRIKRYILENPPDLFVPIDFGAFNVRLSKFVRQIGVKTLYYFPPSSWNRSADYSSLKGLVDAVVTPFPWSIENLRKLGIRAYFFGHPLLETAKPSMSYEEFCIKFGFNRDAYILSLMPGSRPAEVMHNLPVIGGAVGNMHSLLPDLQYGIAVAPSISIDLICRSLKKAEGVQRISVLDDGCIKIQFEGSRTTKLHALPGMATDLLAYSRAGIISSGTATMEAAILGCPMVIIYRAGVLSNLEYKLRRMNLKFIGMPNIILDKEICPELIQEHSTPENISNAILPLILDSDTRKGMIDDLKAVRDSLGSSGAIEKTAELCVKMLSNSEMEQELIYE